MKKIALLLVRFCNPLRVSSAMGVDWPSEREKWTDWQPIFRNQFDMQRGLKIQNPIF
jgi:hypothetical protein